MNPRVNKTIKGKELDALLMILRKRSKKVDS